MIDSPPLLFRPEGLATGIGSLPYTDPHTALDLLEAHLPKIPHWPQLPQRGSRKHFVHQFLQPLVDCGLLIVEEGRRTMDAARTTLADRLTRFYEWCLPAEAGDPRHLQRFMMPQDAAVGFYALLNRMAIGRLADSLAVKGQVAGPLSVGLTLNDHRGRPAYYHDDLRDVMVRTLSLNARCQAKTLRDTGCTPIIFVDDPAINAWGSRLHLALDRQIIQTDLDTIFTAIRSQGAWCGLHACQAVDWSIVFSTDVQILSLDAYRNSDSLMAHADALKRFLSRGGVVAWGIIPTLDDPFAISVESLLRRLFVLWGNLFSDGPDRETLIRQSLITPACGLGLLNRDRAERIYRLNAALVRCLRAAGRAIGQVLAEPAGVCR